MTDKHTLFIGFFENNIRLLQRSGMLFLLIFASFTACDNPDKGEATPSVFERFDQPPNIIWIMADDLGYGDLGAYGQEVIRTPRLDRMAEEGLRFTRFYSGHTVCAPARSTLMTGLHTGKTRVRGNFSQATEDRVPLESGDTTVAEILQKAGYTTGLIGKWGLGEPETTGTPDRKGFDYFWGFLNQARAHKYYPEWVWRQTERVEGAGNYAAQEMPNATYAAMVSRLDRDVGRLLDLLQNLRIEENTRILWNMPGNCFIRHAVSPPTGPYLSLIRPPLHQTISHNEN